MTGLQGSNTVQPCIHVGRGMRVVLFDQDAETRAKVRAAICIVILSHDWKTARCRSVPVVTCLRPVRWHHRA